MDYTGRFWSNAKNNSLRVRTFSSFSVIPEITYDTTLNYLWNTGHDTTNFIAKPTTDSIFSVTATSSVGCATTAHKQIFVSTTEERILYDTICIGYAYKQNGFDLPPDSNLIAGNFTYSKTLTNDLCLVNVILHLTKKPTQETAITDSFCENKSHVHNGVIYQDAGEYVQFLISENGCDSVLHLTLSLKYGVTTALSEQSCGFYVWNSQYYYNSGTYSQTFVATNGCDSVVNKTIEISQNPQGWLELDSCEQVTYNGIVYFRDTTFVDPLTNSVDCDSLLIVNFIIHSSHFDTTHLHGIDSVIHSGNVHYQDTILIFEHQTEKGCDSIWHVHIFVNQTPTCEITYGSLFLDSCNQITYKNIIFFNDTTFTDMLVNSEGCDSLLIVNLTIHQPYFDLQNLYGIDSLEYLSNVYYRDTILIFEHQTIKGCDSIIQIHIFIEYSEPFNPPIPEAEIVVYWNRVLAVPNRQNLDELRYATYYWYKDEILLPQSNKDWIEIGNPIPAGKYNVSIHYGGQEILYLERIFDRPFGVSAYPNPLKTSENLTIQTDNRNIKRIEIFDANGTLQNLPIRKSAVETGCTPSLQINGFKKTGMYILQIYFDDNSIETIKIVVK
jgi:hypothetical protein